MAVRKFFGGGVILGLILGLILFAAGGNAFAQGVYWGDQVCGGCHIQGAETHSINFADYLKHGHKWMLVQTGGTSPPEIPDPVTDILEPLQYPASPDFPGGVPLPSLPSGVTWDQVEYIVGNFKAGEGYVVRSSDGKVNLHGNWSNYSCGKCHTTGYLNDAQSSGHHQKNHLGVEMTGAVGTWQLDNIQCEACHGAGGTMAIPYAADRKCQQCHTADVAAPNTGRNKFNPAVGTHGYLSGSHSQGDEFDVSPHSKAANGQMTCDWCHDPHRSVWHDDGGVSYTEEIGADGKPLGAGRMCLHCHGDVYVRGAMGNFLDCTDCHMPDVSMSGTGATHLFRITTDATDALHNTSFINPNPKLGIDYVLTSGTNDVPLNRSYWLNVKDGQAFLTLDLACTNTCHQGDFSSMQQLAKAAKAIHREPKLLDVTANGGDGPLVVKKGTQVSIDFSVQMDAVGVTSPSPANWYVVCMTPKGLSSWNGKAWSTPKKTQVAWHKNFPLADVDAQNVLKSKTLSPGYYTYWVEIDLVDGSAQYYDSVSVSVTK